MNTPKTSPLATVVADVIALGYRPVPIMPRQKRPGEFVAGRWKAMDTWQRYRQQTPTDFELKQWVKWPDANIGLMMGSPLLDGSIIIGIDLDMRSRSDVARVVAALPKTPMSKTGAKGETLFFRASHEIKTRSFDRVLEELDAKGKHKRERLADFLAAGRQTVIPPSQHPDGWDIDGSASFKSGTGKKITDAFDYRWLRGPVPANELPLFDDAALSLFEDLMVGLGWASDGSIGAPDGVKRAPRPVVPRAPATANVIDFSSSVHKRLNAAALADLDAWVPELDLFRCQRARAGYEAVATWRASTSGRPDEKRKRNLSIQPNGIEDFGAAVKYSPIDLVICAKGVTFNAAYEWLRSFITPDDGTGVVLAFDTSEARRRPEADDRDPTPLETAPDLISMGLPEPVKSAELAPAFFDDDLALKEWPEELCFGTGLVGQIARWIVDTSSAPSPLLAYGAAITLVGTVAGRQFRSPTGTGTHLYVIGAAPTGVGKDHPMQCCVAALHDAGMSAMVGPPDYTADSAVLRTLTDHPLCLSLMDEFGSFWKRINSRKSGTWETAITRALREAWGRSFALMRTKQYAGSGPASQDVWWPALSILGMTTPGELFSALSAADVENGMVNRFLLLATARRIEEKRTREELKISYFTSRAHDLRAPAHIVDGLKAIRDWQGEIVGPQFGWPSITRPNNPTINCTIDEEAMELLFSYQQWITERSFEDDQFGKFYSRGAESAQRLALIHAIGKSVGRSSYDKTPPEITREDVEHAVRLIDWSLRTMWSRIAAAEAPVDLRGTVQSIFRAIDRRGGRASRVELRQSLHGSAKRDIEDAITELEEAGYIKSEQHKKSPRDEKAAVFYVIVKRPAWAS